MSKSETLVPRIEASRKKMTTKVGRWIKLLINTQQVYQPEVGSNCLSGNKDPMRFKEGSPCASAAFQRA